MADTALHPGLSQYVNAPSSVNFKKLRKRLLRQTQDAISQYGMVAGASDESWLICLSGGKDSYALLSLLLDLQARGDLPVRLIACNLDQMQPEFPKTVLPNYLSELGVEHHIITKDTYSIVTEKVPEEKTYCSLCSRLRRGILYQTARDLGCSSIVLGHHRDDALETFMMNLLYGGRLAAMPPRLLNDAGDVFVLRPLITSSEDDIAKFASAMKYPIIPCTLCGSQDGLQRQAMKQRLSEWEAKKPGTKDIMLTALKNVRPSHLLGQPKD